MGPSSSARRARSGRPRIRKALPLSPSPLPRRGGGFLPDSGLELRHQLADGGGALHDVEVDGGDAAVEELLGLLQGPFDADVHHLLGPGRENLVRQVGRDLDEEVAGNRRELLLRGQDLEPRDDRRLDPLLPAMKAHGVPSLISHLAGEITLEEATVIGKADTRHYAKRQFTWFRHQLPEFEWVKPEAAGAWLSAVVSQP